MVVGVAGVEVVAWVFGVSGAGPTRRRRGGRRRLRGWSWTPEARMGINNCYVITVSPTRTKVRIVPARARAKTLAVLLITINIVLTFKRTATSIPERPGVPPASIVNNVYKAPTRYVSGTTRPQQFAPSTVLGVNPDINNAHAVTDDKHFQYWKNSFEGKSF